MRRVHLDHDIKNLAKEIVLVSSQARKLRIYMIYPEGLGAREWNRKRKHVHDKNRHHRYVNYPSISDNTIFAPKTT
jgi:hypothetical protein